MSKILVPILNGSEHVVQFYEADEFIIELICGFVERGLVAGEGLLLLVTDAHQQQMRALLEARGIDLQFFIEQRQVGILSAEQTLAEIM